MNIRSRRREEVYNSSPTSHICMNVKSTSSLLNNDPHSLEEALKTEEADKWTPGK